MSYKLASFKAGYIAPVSKITREKVISFEKLLLAHEDGEVCTMKHHFAPGLYAREMFMPKDTVLTGAVHKTEHLVITVGDVMVTIDGDMTRLTGHNTFLSKPGAKRVMYSVEDTWVTGFFVTDKTDIAEIENDVVEDPDSLQYRRFAKMALEGKSCS
jgi:hypothetical protein